MSAPGTTQGPWSVHPRFCEYVVPDAHSGRPIGGDADDACDLKNYAQTVCEVRRRARHISEAEFQANARLIAAAPALYDALVKARGTINAFYVSMGMNEEGLSLNLAYIDAALAAARSEQTK